MKPEYKGATFQKAHVEHRQTYKLSKPRPWYRRLTPLAWFCIVLLFAGIVAFTSLAVNTAIQRAHEFVPLEAVVTQPAPTVAASQVAKAMPAAKPAQPTSMPTAPPTLRPTVAPTALPTVTPAVPSGVPWAADLKKMPDGTLGAPSYVINMAMADLREWWVLNQTLDAKLLVQDPSKLLNQYFIDAALDDQHEQFKTGRYTLNRGGRFSIEVKDFSADGLTAKAGVVMRARVDAVIDTIDGNTIEDNLAGKDTLTLLTIRYDLTESRWKISQIDDVIELKEGG